MIKEREVIKEVKRVVIKVGTSTIAHTGGLINIYRMEHLARMISDLKNRGYQVNVIKLIKPNIRPDSGFHVNQSPVLYFY